MFFLYIRILCVGYGVGLYTSLAIDNVATSVYETAMKIIMISLVISFS